MTEPTFRYHYFPERREWIGVVTEGATVVTIACEETRDAILEWWDTYQMTEGQVESDMYDRAKDNLQ
jgi:KaiC/GvpD/RAD55 family RecA-like ATPase